MPRSMLDYIMDGRSSHNRKPKSGHKNAQKQLDALDAEHKPRAKAKPKKKKVKKKKPMRKKGY